MSFFNFDPVGNLVANRIQNETHTVSVINGVDHNYIVPVNAPFYDESVVLVDKLTGNSLIPAVDYFFGYSFIEATENTGKPVSGAIVFVDPNRSGSFNLNYQTLGGEYVNDETRAIESGIDTLVNITNGHWDNIVNLPEEFPPTPHTHRLSSVAGVTDILAKFTTLESAIRSPERHIMMADIVDLNEGYIQPFTQAMADVAAAILELSMNQNQYHVEQYTDSVNRMLPPGNIDQWIDVGISLSPMVDGTFQVIMAGNPNIVVPDAHPEYEFRYLVDGVRISRSSLSNSLVGLTATQVISLQIKVKHEVATSIQVSGLDVACGLTLLKVGE